MSNKKDFLILKFRGKKTTNNFETVLYADDNLKNEVVFTCETCTKKEICRMNTDSFEDWNFKCAYQERYIR